VARLLLVNIGIGSGSCVPTALRPNFYSNPKGGTRELEDFYLKVVLLIYTFKALFPVFQQP
jgi:hypothetical protein